MSNLVHPEPPPDLHARVLPLLPLSGSWARAYRLDHGPLYFGRHGAERFDDPDKVFGVCYFGENVDCAFIETVPVPLELPGRRLFAVRSEALVARGWATVGLARADKPLVLIDLTGSGLSQVGADNDLCTCRDYAVPQRWSAALHAHPAVADGILYRARHDPSLTSVALFDRAEAKIVMVPRGAWGSRGMVAELARIIGKYAVSTLPPDNPG